MTLLLFLGTYIDLLVRWWKVNLGLAVTWLIGLFGDPVVGAIDPNIAIGIKEVVITLATLFTAVVTIYIAWKKGKRELNKIEQDVSQEKQEHRLKMLSELKDRNDLSPENKEKIEELVNVLISDLSK